MNRILMGMLLALMLSGCGRKAVPPVAAKSPATNPPTAPLPIRPISATPAAEPGSATAMFHEQKLNWQVKIAWIPEDAIEPLGLKEFFSASLMTNAIAAAELQHSALRGVARTYTNVVLKSETAGVAGVCVDQTASNLVDALEMTTGADVLTPWPVQTIGSNEARAIVTANSTIVVAQTAAGSPLVTNLAFGQNVWLRVLPAANESVTLEAAVRGEAFNGYTDAGNSSNTQPEQPKPLFSLDVLGGRAELKSNEALLMGGPMFSHVTKTVDRVMYLSDIPGLGKFFTKVQSKTNHLRSLVVIRRVLP